MTGLCCLGSDESVKNALTTKWVSYAGGESFTDKVCGLATDASTNAYFGGMLGSGFFVSQDNLIQANLLMEPAQNSGYVAKADKDGALQWVSTLDYGLGGSTYGLVATNNVVYSAGFVNDQIDVDGDTWIDAILSSLNAADGTLNWSHELSSVSESNYYNTQSAYRSVAVDIAGNIYAVGYTTMTNLTSSSVHAGGKDAVVVKYASSGNLLWVRYLGGVNDDEANAVSIGQDGLYVSGTTRSPHWFTLGTNTLPSVSNSYGFLAKLTFNGAVTNVIVLGGNGNDEILSMQTISNTIYLAGTTYSANFCTATNQLNKLGGDQDGFVLKLTDNGTTYTTNWFRYVGTNTMDAVYALALMDPNRVVVCGSTGVGGWMPEHDEASKAYSGGTDGFILQLNRYTGAPIWSTYVGGASNDAATTLAVAEKSVFLGGTTDSPEWPMSGGFQDAWSPYRYDFAAGETGFVGKWSQEPGVPPVITNDIASVTVNVGTTNVFFLGVSSKIAVNYYWFRNGVSTGISTNRLVVGPAVSSDDGTFYQCIASNAFGCATSSVAHLFIAKGILAVSLTPSLAAAQGATWQLTGGVWRASEAISVYPGTYTVAFTNMPGWITPATRQVEVVSSQTTNIVAVYVQTGFLHVSILPSDVVAQGAVWQLDGDIWHTNGVIELAPGTYNVAFTNIPGKITPATRQINVVSGQTTNVVAVYYDEPFATAVRTITSWTNVSLSVTCPLGVSAWTLIEQIPANVTPTLYPPGTWNATARTLTYTGTVSSTIGYTALLAVAGDNDITNSIITSMTNNLTKPVTGDHTVSRGNFLRKISGTNVWIYMAQPTILKYWGLTESLAGTTLTPDSISMPDFATWDPDAKTLYWARSSIGASVVLSYSVSGTAGSTNTITGGTCFVSPNNFYTIFGDNTVIIPPVSEPAVPVPPPTILGFVWNGTSASLTFTSIVAQAYSVLTNANISVTNGWKNCVPATGQGAITTVTVPVLEPQLFYRVKSD
jgi:hypothetical protein